MRRRLEIRGGLVGIGAWGVALSALGGCCLTSITGFGTAGPGTSGSTGGKSPSSAASSSAAGSTGASSSGTGSGARTTGGTSSAGTSSGGTSGGATMSGASTGSISTAPAALLLDAGADTIFGPVAIAVVPEPSGVGAARLVYSVGDGGQFGIMLQSITGDGGPLGVPIQIGTTQLSLSSPPNVAVSDDGTATALCWEDYSVPWSVAASPDCDPSYSEQVVSCATVPENGGIPDASYSNCGWDPSLVFNPSSRDTQLFFMGVDFTFTPIDEWAYDQAASVSQEISAVDSANPTGVPLPDQDGVIYTRRMRGGPGGESSGVLLATSAYAEGGYFGQSSTVMDPVYTSYDPEGCGEGPVPFVAASNLGADIIEVLEWQRGVTCQQPGQLLQFIWQVDAGVGGTPTEIQSTAPLVGAIAVGVCPDAFENFMTTALGTVLVAKVGFDGGMGDAPSYLTLPGFNQTPGLSRVDNSGLAEPSTSMAVAPAPGGKLFLAISNPWQVGVYVVDCE